MIDRHDPDYGDHVRHYETHDNRFKVQCKYCSQVGFEWRNDNGNWILYDYLGEKHSCKKDKFGTFFKGEK